MFCHSQLPFLLFVCLALLFPLICSSVLNRESKASASLQRLLAACVGQKTLKCGESNFDKKSCGLQRSGTVKNRAVAVRRNMTAIALFWSPGKVKCSLGCWPKLTTAPMYGQRDCQPALRKNCFTDVIVFRWYCVKEAFYVSCDGANSFCNHPKFTPCTLDIGNVKGIQYFLAMCHQSLRISTTVTNRHIWLISVM